MTILFFGDIVGKPGRRAVAKILPGLKKEHQPDLTVANIENLAHGKGVTMSTLEELLGSGVDFCTSGNHVYDKPLYEEVFKKHGDKIIRPANFADNYPGDGYKIITVKDVPVLMVNLLGQVFMDKQVDQSEVSSPYENIDAILQKTGDQAKIRFLDFHAEATSEIKAMGLYLDGRMSGVLGTHTHVQTADAQVLPGGTGYLTDVGMTGAAYSVIGFAKEGAIARLLSDPQRTKKISIEPTDELERFETSYAVLEIDEDSGKCKNIKGYWYQEHK